MVLVMAEKNYYTALSRRRFVVYLTWCAAEMPLLSAYLQNFKMLTISKKVFFFLQFIVLKIIEESVLFICLRLQVFHAKWSTT